MSKDGVLYVRISDEELERFKKKCDFKHADVVREIVTAFNEGRLKIQRTKEQKKAMEEYYD